MDLAAPSTTTTCPIETFAEEGFVVYERAIEPEACDALLAALSALIERVASEHLARTRTERAFWKLLRGSAHTAEVFFDSAADLDALPAPSWEQHAMRVGHGLHVVEPAFAAFCRRAEIAAPLRSLAHVAAVLSAGATVREAAQAALRAPGPARFVQSAVIYKQPNSEAVQFGMHRDAAYLQAEPESLVLAFVALDPTTQENGCLAVIPRSHTEPLGMRLRLDADGFTPVGREPRPEEERRVLLPMERGSIAFVHGRTLHGSEPNRSEGPRRALIVHAMNERSALSEDAWVKTPASGFPSVD